jgi:hypothetical protein
VRYDQEAYSTMLAMIIGPDDRPGWAKQLTVIEGRSPLERDTASRG